METTKNKKLNIFLICFLVTGLLMISKKTDIIKTIGDTLNIRYLFDNPKIDYICDKAGNSLKKKYSNGYDEKFETKRPNKAQNAIINYVRDSEYEYIKDYFSRIAIFFIFLILDFIFIFCWISYCICGCCSCCCFKTANPSSKIKRFIFFLISAICNLLIIIFSIVAMKQIGPFVKRINGVACSSFTFVDHIRDGLGTSYPKVSNRWLGILGIMELLNETEIKYSLVLNNSELEKNIQYAKSNYTELEPDTCGIKNIIKQEDFENEMNNLYDLINSSSFGSIDFQEEIDNIDEAYNKFTETEDDICGDVYDALHDYVNKYVKKIYIVYFIIILIFGLLGLLFLILYYLTKNNCFRIVYIIIWNISMLLMLLSILIGIIFGVSGTILHDGVRVVQYALSEDNLHSEDPIIIKNNEYTSDLINTCINGNGEFLYILQENEEIKKNIDKFNQNSIEFNNTIKTLSNLNCNDEKSNVAKNSIINVYSSLLDKNNIVQNMSLNLMELNCRFVGNDEKIIINEINSISKKALLICACSLLIGIFFGISILAGILFVHRYKYVDELKPNPVVQTNDSSTNINGQNTQNNISLNNNDKGKE